MLPRSSAWMDRDFVLELVRMHEYTTVQNKNIEAKTVCTSSPGLNDSLFKNEPPVSKEKINVNQQFRFKIKNINYK